MKLAKVLFTLCLIVLSTSVQATDNRFMKLTGLVDNQHGHVTFCQQNPEECLAQPPAPLVEFGGSQWQLIRHYNQYVNGRVTPVADADNYQVSELWNYPNGFDELRGDCEDIALLKRRLLMLGGIAPANLLLTVVNSWEGGHLVLTVRTDQGDFILDNLTDKIKLWSQTPYRFLWRQFSVHANVWMGIEDSR